MFTRQEGYLEYTFEGEHKVGYFHRIRGSESILVSSINWDEVFVPTLKWVINSVLGLVILSILASVAFMTVFDRRYVKPVKLLKERLAALLGGRSVENAPNTYPNKEFLEIAGSIEALTKRILSQKTEELNAILESSSDGILVLDRNNRILHYNMRFLALWGLAEGGAYQTFADLGLQQRMMDERDCGRISEHTDETGLCYLKSGIILERYVRLLSKQEHIDGILCVFRDVTQKVKKEEKLKEIANTDFLTGLNNRRYFSFLAALEFRKAMEDAEPLSLLLIDIDNFKSINDTFGHDVGDQALKTFAEHLRQCSRSSDVLCRYGGEEFCVLLPETDLVTANQIAERVRLHFERMSLNHEGRPVAWTISIGVALLNPQVRSVDMLIKHADIACYQAKQNGRNCVMSFSGQGQCANTVTDTETEE